MTDPERLNLPSASADWVWNCAGAWRLWQTLGCPAPEAESDDAKRGTKIHAAFETGSTLELDEEEAETYAQGMKFLDLLLQGWQADRNLPVITEGPRESRFWIRDYDFTLLASAKLDRHWIVGTEAFVCDFKSGFVPNLAPSPRSTQLRVQLVALCEEHPELEYVRVAYCKPKLKRGAEDHCDYNKGDIEHARNWVHLWLWQSRQPDSPRTPGKHCNYCPNLGACLEGGSFSLLPSVIAARALGKPDLSVDEAVAVLAPADLLKIFTVSGTIGKILDAVKARLKAMPDEQLSDLGLMRGKGRETRKVTAVPEAREHLINNKCWSEQDVLSCMQFSNEALEQMAKRNHSLESDKTAKAWVKKELEPFSTVSTAEPPIRVA